MLSAAPGIDPPGTSQQPLACQAATAPFLPALQCRHRPNAAGFCYPRHHQGLSSRHWLRQEGARGARGLSLLPGNLKVLAGAPSKMRGAASQHTISSPRAMTILLDLPGLGWASAPLSLRFECGPHVSAAALQAWLIMTSELFLLG